MNKGQVEALMKNKEEFEKTAKKGFEEADTNKNGAIDFDEVQKILINFAKHNNLITPTKKEVENVYTQLDKDKNGKVDFEEFKVFFKKFLEMQYCS